MSDTVTSLMVDYFDGHSARAHRVRMWIDNEMLQLAGRDLIRQVPLRMVQWPERTRHGVRLAHFEDGGSVQALESAGWDDWCRTHQLGESLVVRAQQSWRWSMVAVALLVMVTIMGYWWGLPLAARTVVPLIPASIDQEVGRAALDAIDAQWLKPSKLPVTEQARLRARFNQAAERHARATRRAAHRLPVSLQWHFRHGRIGPNAFALPDGSIIITDELIDLLHDREDALLGIIGHEVAHVALRHGMRTLIQTSLLGAATSVALGDFSSVLAGAPAILGHMAYSRAHEREADEAAILFMRHNDIRPSSMVVLFERLAAYQKRQQGDADQTESGSDIFGIAFSSHPPDEERIARFKAADLAPLATGQVSSKLSL